jgi:hypothetical protein
MTPQLNDDNICSNNNFALLSEYDITQEVVLDISSSSSGAGETGLERGPQTVKRER